MRDAKYNVRNKFEFKCDKIKSHTEISRQSHLALGLLHPYAVFKPIATLEVGIHVSIRNFFQIKQHVRPVCYLR